MNFKGSWQMVPTLTDQERAIHDEPGPFSVYGYLDQLLRPGFYGDELCLMIISMIWKVRITILHAETLTAIKVRHMNVALKADFILVHCSGSHYISLGNYFYFYNATLFIHNCTHNLIFTLKLYLLHHINHNAS